MSWRDEVESITEGWEGKSRGGDPVSSSRTGASYELALEAVLVVAVVAAVAFEGMAGCGAENALIP